MLPKLQEAVMLLLARHGPDCTANKIQELLTEARGTEQAFGSIFTTLDRLTDKKFATWRRGEPEPRRGGRAPRLYTITAEGRRALRASLQTTAGIVEGWSVQPGPASPVPA